MRIPKSPKTCLSVLLLYVWVPWASAQQTAAPGGSTGNAGGTTPQRVVVPRPPVFSQPQPSLQPSQDSTPQLIFLSGTVIREDGSAPPYGAVIDLNCGGTVTRGAIVGLNGRFSFQWGGDNRVGQVFPDASQGDDQYSDIYPGFASNSGFPLGTQSQRTRRLLGCELKAQLAGYRSTGISVTEEPMSGPNELGTIVVYPNSRVQGNMVSLTNLMAPKSAKKSVEQARKAARKEKFADAEELFKSAIQLYPKYAEAWFDLGLVYEHQGRAEETIKAYREAIRADELFLKPYTRLAHFSSTGQNWREAADLTEKVLSLDPVTQVDAYLISALANFKLGEVELSEKRARQGQRMDYAGHFPQFYLMLANIFAVKHDDTACIRELRSYLKSAPKASNASLVRSQLQKLEEQAKQSSAASHTSPER